MRRQQRCIWEEVNTDAHVATYDREYPQTIEMVFVAWVLFIHILLHIVWILDLLDRGSFDGYLPVLYCCVPFHILVGYWCCEFSYQVGTSIGLVCPFSYTNLVLVFDWYWA